MLTTGVMLSTRRLQCYTERSFYQIRSHSIWPEHRFSVDPKTAASNVKQLPRITVCLFRDNIAPVQLLEFFWKTWKSTAC